MRSCPRCFCPLKVQQEQGISIDYCDTCGGVWYDREELPRIMGRDSLFERALRRAGTSRGHNIACPACARLMEVRLLGGGGLPELEIDLCGSCGGIWLDSGELDRLLEYAPLLSGQGQAASRDSALISALSHYSSMDYEYANREAKIGGATYVFCLLSQLPVEVYNPRRSFPMGLFLLVGVNVMAWFFLVFLVLVHTGLVQANSFMQALSPAWIVKTFGLVPAELFKGHFLPGLFSYGFLHAGFWHLFANMYMLWIFGDNVYDWFMDRGAMAGRLLFFGHYILLMVISGLFHCLLARGETASAIPLVGASGAVSGIMASYCRLFPGTRLYQVILFVTFKMPVWAYLLIWVVIQLLMGAVWGMASQVSWSAHLAGFLAGYLITPLYQKNHFSTIEK